MFSVLKIDMKPSEAETVSGTNVKWENRWDIPNGHLLRRRFRLMKLRRAMFTVYRFTSNFVWFSFWLIPFGATRAAIYCCKFLFLTLRHKFFRPITQHFFLFHAGHHEKELIALLRDPDEISSWRRQMTVETILWFFFFTPTNSALTLSGIPHVSSYTSNKQLDGRTLL